MKNNFLRPEIEISTTMMLHYHVSQFCHECWEHESHLVKYCIKEITVLLGPYKLIYHNSHPVQLEHKVQIIGISPLNKIYFQE